MKLTLIKFSTCPLKILSCCIAGWQNIFRRPVHVHTINAWEVALIQCSQVHLEKNVTGLGNAMVKIDQRLRELGSVTPLEKLVDIYLAGLDEKFEQIRYDIMKDRKANPDLFANFAELTTLVEDYACSRHDIKLSTFVPR